MSENNNTNIEVFLDTIGRTIVGEKVADETNTIGIKNPVVLNVVPADGGRMSIQLLPIFFKEFLGDKSGDVIFNFTKSSITTSNISVLDFRLLNQYKQMFSVNNQLESTASNEPDVVKLFDEE